MAVSSADHYYNRPLLASIALRGGVHNGTGLLSKVNDFVLTCVVIIELWHYGLRLTMLDTCV